MADPERNMIMVAFLIANVEMFITTLQKVNLIWATTVLLGGFVSDLHEIDFWTVSLILGAEGSRLLRQMGEQHRSSSNSCIAILSFIADQFMVVLTFLLSSTAFIHVDYGPGERNVALQFFYYVSMVGSGLVLVALLLKLYSGISPNVWSSEGKLGERFRATWRSRWVLKVKKGYNLDDTQIITLYRFFHHTYSRCASGSILDSSNITIVSYSVELLQSSNGDEQLKGARLLSGLVKENPLALERLRSIGTIRSVVEMLIDMLNWDLNEFPDMGIRVAAAEIISNLVGIGRNRTLVMAAPNCMESIASLLDDGNQVEINSSQNRTQSSPKYPYSDFSKTGLSILKLLASDHDNRAKMGSNRGLLLKIIALTESNDPHQLHLKMLAIETLTSIARDQDFREIIGCIDGVLHNLFSLFLMKITIGNVELACKAGEALGFLSLDSNQNCEIMKSIRRAYFRNLIPRLISLLNDQVRGTYAARILRNLSAYLEAYPEANSVELSTIKAASAQVVDLVTEKEGVHQEAAIGLAAQIFKFLSQADYDLIIGEPRARSLISTLLDVLRQKASKELPNIRRFSILLLIAVMRKGIRLTIRNESQIKMDLRNALEGATNTSVLESYSTFSGTIGLRSDSMAIPFLAQSAMELLDK